VIAGSEGNTGAAALAAIAAGRAGAGLVTVACPASLGDVLEQKCTEAMTAPVAETSDRALAQAAAAELARLASERDVVALGPGIGRSDETQKLVRSLVAQIERPLVLDADGLFPFAADREPLGQRAAATVLTPHPGEAAHLLGTTAAAVNADRLAAARELASRFDAVTLLKGAATVVATPDGRAIVNPTGGPELSTGGSGDVLTGMVAAYLAQGLEPALAAAAAAYVHGACGDALALAHGRSGMLAGDLAQALPGVMHALRRDAEAGKERDGDAVHRRSGPAAGLLVSFPDP
jgi:NAD(P)H-hydrate epimerase